MDRGRSFGHFGREQMQVNRCYLLLADSGSRLSLEVLLAHGGDVAQQAAVHFERIAEQAHSVR
jgi:hypothetical protein